VSPGSTAPTYFAHVDGLRALAVLSVMLFHLHPAVLPGGFVGVDVFFVVSGYVVTASLAGHRNESAGAFLARYYGRRLARLVPALVTMLVVTTAL
jgi:peptidoglycan/LPS O-acetylase OafA/YrhL